MKKTFNYPQIKYIPISEITEFLFTNLAGTNMYYGNCNRYLRNWYTLRQNPWLLIIMIVLQTNFKAEDFFDVFLNRLL